MKAATTSKELATAAYDDFKRKVGHAPCQECRQFAFGVLESAGWCVLERLALHVHAGSG